MAEELKKKRRNGYHFFLALVDPLLEHPEYFPLMKPEVTVGFVDDCDWLLPWTSMGIDVLTDSRRFDETFKDNQRSRICDQSLSTGGIGNREKEPFFSMKYDRSSGWSVECDYGHGCRVVPCGKPPSRVFYCNGGSDCDGDHTNRDRASGIKGLRDGSAFRFEWPSVALEEDTNGPGLPVQSLRFVFVASRHNKFPVAHVSNQLNLLSLPKDVLARIASYLPPTTVVSELAVVARVYVSPIMKNMIPWNHVHLDGSFDSLRIAELASPEAIRHVSCEVIWSAELKKQFWAAWKPIINHEHLEILEIGDPILLHSVGMPPNLKDFRIWTTVADNPFWEYFRFVRFPHSVSRLRVSVRFDNPDLDKRMDPLSPRWLFSAFRGLEELRIRYFNFTNGEWDSIPGEHLQRVTRFHLTTAYLSFKFIPFARMLNLVHLEVLPVYECLDGVSLPALKTLIFTMDEEDCKGFPFVKAPQLSALSATSLNEELPGGIRLLTKIVAKYSRLRKLRLRGLRASPLSLYSLLLKSKVMCAKIEGLNKKVLPENSFPDGSGVKCVWNTDGQTPSFDFHFGRK